MSQQKKSTQKKSSSENHNYKNIEQSQLRTGSSLKRPTYPNVPKRTRKILSIDEHETIETESRIDIIPSDIHSKNVQGSSDRNAYTRHTLDLITKYTSPKKTLQTSQQEQSEIITLSNKQSIYGSKSKRTLSPLDKTDQQIHESKRSKLFDDDDDDDDDDELSQFIDHRRYRSKSSQNNNITNILSQVTNDNEQKKSTVRKPTVRKLSTSQRKPSASQPISVETLFIEPDIDLEEEINSLNNHNQYDIINGPIIPSPIKLPIDNCIDSLKSNNSFTPIKICSSRQIFENPLDNSSPYPNQEIERRRFSSTSSCFDTPNSSFSRVTTTNNTISIPQNIIKINHETQISYPSNIDMIKKLISQMNNNNNNIDYNSIEISTKFFHQYSSNNTKYPIINLLNTNKQYLYFGQYKIEILFPLNDNQKRSIIYTCDICLKHFFGSKIAFQRHTSKCLYSQPPGKLVFNQDDLAIFEIDGTNVTLSQRIYLKSLCRIVRLFMDSNKIINDTKIDRFIYYVLCRRDPILSQFQPSIYRFIGYFSKQLNQYSKKIINNISCLFILPSFIKQKEYYQLLISFSYSLIQSNSMYSSPARPIDILTLNAFRTYWRDILFVYIINCSLKSFALDIFTRHTSIHPRDILSSLYSYDFIVRHSIDKSSVYIHNNAIRLMKNLNINNRFLLMNINNNEQKQSSFKNDDSDTEEIILD